MSHLVRTDTLGGALTIPRAVLATERSARAAWSALAEPEDPRVRDLIAEFGPIEGLLAGLSGRDSKHRIFIERAARTDLGEATAFAMRHGIHLLIPGDPEWPEGVNDLTVPPVCLWVMGDPDLSSLARRSVAIVGARMSTPYGNQVAASMAAGVVERGYAVVSGAAFGIDKSAHLGALSCGGRTVAVLAGGVDRAYPTAHAGLIAEIAETGSVMAECAPGWAPTRPRFLLRNRLIATMTAGTIVVEAGLRSGSLNTARSAARHCRPVGAVPGSVMSQVSAGCHGIVRDGLATLVCDAKDVLDLVGVMGVDAAPHQSDPVQPEDRLDPVDAIILAAVPRRGAASVDTVAFTAGQTVAEVMGALARLELGGFVSRHDGGWKRRRSSRREAPS